MAFLKENHLKNTHCQFGLDMRENPILNGVDGIIWTYGVPRVFFVNDNALKTAKDLTGWDEIADALEMRVYEDLIKTNEGYFGDWELSQM
ncbi:TPA: hypothetical protein ACIZA9_003019 [Legionella pneumophila]